MKRWLIIGVLAVGASFAIRTWVVERIVIATGSMEPTLPTGTRYFADKLSYRFRGPRRGEVVVLRSPIDAAREVVKRVMAGPGDRIEIRDKVVFVNDEKLVEPYVKHTRAAERLVDDDFGPLTVPPDEYFVLGDNRDVSRDSRDWAVVSSSFAFVPRSDLRARVLGAE